MKKIPYGQSNFSDLIESGYAYVDKTRYIELLENENNRYQFHLRPRRFGKSLFLSVLENYYDINRKENFSSLFSNLYIGNNPTPEQGMYAILKFDFSDIDTGNQHLFRESFLKEIKNSVLLFFKKYKKVFLITDDEIRNISEQTPSISLLLDVYRYAEIAKIYIFVLIDEYDNFANNLVAVNNTYRYEILEDGIVRTFYKSLKKGTSSVIRRIFITGVSPMMFNDLTSGFNMADNCSLLPVYNEMFGFTKDEVEWLVNETGIDKQLIKVDMESYYNGYMFNNDGKDKVYNSQMVLFIFNQIFRLGKQPNQIIDTNLKTDYAKLQRLAENKNNQKKILDIIRDDGISCEIIVNFSINELGKEENFVSLLFYLGMLTCGGTYHGRTWLKIPNYSIKTLYWEYINYYIEHLDNILFDYSEIDSIINIMSYDGNIVPFLNFFSNNFLNRLSNRDLINFDEKYIKVMLLSSMYMSKCYLPISEDENINGYTDIYLQRHPAINAVKYEYVIELKYIKKGTSKKDKEAKFTEAFNQIEMYKKDARFANRVDIKYFAIVFFGKNEYEAREM